MLRNVCYDVEIIIMVNKILEEILFLMIDWVRKGFFVVCFYFGDFSLYGVVYE